MTGLGYTTNYGLGIQVGVGSLSWNDIEYYGYMAVKYRPFWFFIAPYISTEILISEANQVVIITPTGTNYSNLREMISIGIDFFPDFILSLNVNMKYDRYSLGNNLFCASLIINW